MRQLAAGVVVLIIVFGAGVLTGRATHPAPASDDDPDPEATALLPGSAGMPLPLGEEAIIGAWTVRVADVDLGATDQVLAANQFNTPPQDDDAFVLIDVVAHRRSGGPGILRGTLEPALVTPAGGTYAVGNDCGVLRHPLDVQQPVGVGQELSGQWCWSVSERDVPKVALRVGGAASGEPVWFALR